MKKIKNSTNRLDIPLQFTESQHLICRLYINNNEGLFLIDTGASNSCIDHEKASDFDLIPEGDSLPMTAASETQLTARGSQKSILGTQEQSIMEISFMLIDLQTINDALEKQYCLPIDGIIGADVLQENNAIVDYGRAQLSLQISQKSKTTPMPF